MKFISQIVKYLSLAIILLLVIQNRENSIQTIDFLNYSFEVVPIGVMVIASFVLGALWGAAGPYAKLLSGTPKESE